MRASSDIADTAGSERGADIAQATANGKIKKEPVETVESCIVLIEPRLLVRECLTRCIEASSRHKVAPYPSVQSWLDAREKARAPLVVYCLCAKSNSAEQLHDLARLTRLLPTVVLSDGEDLDQVLDVINRGARGFIPTSLSLDVVIEALRLVRAGGVFVPASSLIPALRNAAPRPTAGREPSGIFTARQAAVVEAIGKGKANKTIAHELNMRESTVKVHVRNIMKKLSAKNRTEVALMANRLLGEPSSIS
jgi:DNA-binding NarL/FixJ family response regulator